MSQPPEEPTLSVWESLYSDKAALVESPQSHQHLLIELANSLHAKGVVSDTVLSDLLEQADAAYLWGVEAQLSAELSGSTDR